MQTNQDIKHAIELAILRSLSKETENKNINEKNYYSLTVTIIKIQD